MFESHGSFELLVSGNILFVKIIGGWNIESAWDYGRAIQHNIQPLLGKPWAMLSDMDEWELFTPDCKELIFKLTEMGLENGLQREAMVDFRKSVKLQHFPHSITGFPAFKRHFCQTRTQALSWLQSEGFEP